jgi:Outer membrane protein Omp28
MRKLILLLLPTLWLAGCDYVDEPLGDVEGPVGPGASVPRRILLEDCTGHTCNNCPQAARIAEDLKDLYGDDLIIVGVHMVDGFSEPIPPTFDADFRTEAGAAYEETFDITSLPKGMVSRKRFNNSVKLSREDWGSAAAAIHGQEADLDLWFENVTYDTGSNTATLTVKAACVKPMSGDHALTIYLLEDSIIDAQLDQDADPDLVLDYVHRHVLRDNVNDTWGAPFVVGSAAVGDTLVASYTYPLSANVLEPAHCSLVAYVYSTGGSDQYEVKQVAEAKLIP